MKELNSLFFIINDKNKYIYVYMNSYIDTYLGFFLFCTLIHFSSYSFIFILVIGCIDCLIIELIAMNKQTHTQIQTYIKKEININKKVINKLFCCCYFFHLFEILMFQ
jgi:hypothetical protein